MTKRDVDLLNLICKQLNDSTSGFFFSLGRDLKDPKNLAHYICCRTYKRAMVAFIECCKFDHLFNLIQIPKISTVGTTYLRYAGTIPEKLYLKGIAASIPLTGSQFAYFNTCTLELQFDMYTVLPNQTPPLRKGKGKIPLDEYGYLEMSKVVPFY